MERNPGWRESPGTPSEPLLPFPLFADEHDEVQPLRDLRPRQKPQTSFQCPLHVRGKIMSHSQGAATEVQRPRSMPIRKNDGVQSTCLPGSSYPPAVALGRRLRRKCRQCLDVEESRGPPSGPGQMMQVTGVGGPSPRARLPSLI